VSAGEAAGTGEMSDRPYRDRWSRRLRGSHAKEIAANAGYTRRELDRIERLARDRVERLIRRWNEECGATVP
jgi:hypothetical protein